jgi:hypothetical protein
LRGSFRSNEGREGRTPAVVDVAAHSVARRKTESNDPIRTTNSHPAAVAVAAAPGASAKTDRRNRDVAGVLGENGGNGL